MTECWRRKGIGRERNDGERKEEGRTGHDRERVGTKLKKLA